MGSQCGLLRKKRQCATLDNAERVSWSVQFDLVAVRLDAKREQQYLKPRSQELYKILGVLDDIRAKALRIVPMRMYRLPEGVEPITTFAIDPAVPATPAKPFVRPLLSAKNASTVLITSQSNALMLGQNHSEAILRDHLRRLNCEVEFGTALYGIQSENNHVVAHVLKKDGGHESVETIRCHWLVGTDGARGEQ